MVGTVWYDQFLHVPLEGQAGFRGSLYLYNVDDQTPRIPAGPVIFL